MLNAPAAVRKTRHVLEKTPIMSSSFDAEHTDDAVPAVESLKRVGTVGLGVGPRLVAVA
jgi:hypothetical protein